MNGANTTHKHWTKDWLAWVLVIALTYGTLCIVSLASDVGRPFPGFITYYNAIAWRMDVEWNVPGWWWQTEQANLGVNDRLREVEGVPFYSIDRAPDEAELYQRVWDEGGREVSILTRLGETDEERWVDVPLSLFSWTQFVDLLFAPVVTSAIFWFLALILYRATAGPQQTPNERLIIFILGVFSLVGFSIKPGLFVISEGWRNVLTYVNPLFFVSFNFGGALFIHLAFNFPYVRWPRLKGWVLPLAYGVGIVIYLFYFVSRVMILLEGNNDWWHWLDAQWFFLYQRFAGLGFALLVARLFFEMRASLPPKTREWQQAALLLIGLAIFSLTIIFSLPFLNDLIASFSWLPLLADPRFSSLAIPLALTIITLRYRTFEGGETWLLVALMGAVSGLAANFAVVMLFWQMPELIRGLPFPPTAVLFLFFFTLSLVWGWQSSWRGLLGRLFHWERVSYNQALTFGRQLATQNYADEQKLTQAIAHTLTEALWVRYTAVYLTHNSQMNLSATAGDLPPELPSTLPTPAPCPTKPYRPANNEPLAHLFPVWLPLWGEGNAVGMIGVGERWDTAVFTDPDLEILDLIAQQAAIFLQNSRQTQQLRQADQQLIHIQEQTQRKTAQDLHDHVVPTLTQLQLQLQTSQYLLEQDPAQARQQLQESLARLQENTAVVRRIQKDLGVRPVEYGLTPYLHDMLNHFQQDSGLTVTVQWLDNLDQLVPQREARHALYSVWQEALNNIRAHAQATHVTISLAIVPDEQELAGKTWLQFEIRDNGRGSSAHGREQALREGHMGLRGMRIRLESVGGKFAFQSTEGHGTAVSGWLPIALDNSKDL